MVLTCTRMTGGCKLSLESFLALETDYLFTFREYYVTKYIMLQEWGKYTHCHIHFQTSSVENLYFQKRSGCLSHACFAVSYALWPSDLLSNADAHCCGAQGNAISFASILIASNWWTSVRRSYTPKIINSFPAACQSCSVWNGGCVPVSGVV